MPPRATVIDIF